jgi:hypothetical protein
MTNAGEIEEIVGIGLGEPLCDSCAVYTDTVLPGELDTANPALPLEGPLPKAMKSPAAIDPGDPPVAKSK